MQKFASENTQLKATPKPLSQSQQSSTPKNKAKASKKDAAPKSNPKPKPTSKLSQPSPVVEAATKVVINTERLDDNIKIVRPNVVKAHKIKTPPRELTLAEKMLNATISIFIIALLGWLFSSVILRTAAVRNSIKWQKVEFEIAELSTEIRGLEISIEQLKNRDRLLTIAKELGLEYSWERVKVIVK